MSNHTPGPWHVINGSDVFSSLGQDSGDGCVADESDGWQIADCSVGLTSVCGFLTSLGAEVVSANALLISKAPELLNALKQTTLALEQLRRGFGVEASGLCYPSLNIARELLDILEEHV